MINRTILEEDRDNPFHSDSDKSKTERFTSRSTIAERTIDRKEKFISIDSLSQSTRSFNSSVDLGNIELGPRGGGTSKADEGLAAMVRRRERSREQDENVRRISVHQERMDFNDSPTSSPPSVSFSAITDTSTSPRLGGDRRSGGISSSPQGTLESRVEVKTKYKSSLNIIKSKPVKYKIEYLGAVPIRSKATSLESLQV